MHGSTQSTTINSIRIVCNSTVLKSVNNITKNTVLSDDICQTLFILPRTALAMCVIVCFTVCGFSAGMRCRASACIVALARATRLYTPPTLVAIARAHRHLVLRPLPPSPPTCHSWWWPSVRPRVETTATQWCSRTRWPPRSHAPPRRRTWSLGTPPRHGAWPSGHCRPPITPGKSAGNPRMTTEVCHWSRPNRRPSRYRARCLGDIRWGHPWQDDARQLVEDSRCIEDTTGITADLHEQRVDPLKPVSYLERLAVCEDWQQHGVSVSTRVRLPDNNIVLRAAANRSSALSIPICSPGYTPWSVGARHPSRVSTWIQGAPAAATPVLSLVVRPYWDGSEVL